MKAKHFVIGVTVFLLGMLTSFYFIVFNEKVHIETSDKLVITQDFFAETCRDICYYNVMGEPYPGSCQEGGELIEKI